jgi:hypothetical protein
MNLVRAELVFSARSSYRSQLARLGSRDPIAHPCVSCRAASVATGLHRTGGAHAGVRSDPKLQLDRGCG